MQYTALLSEKMVDPLSLIINVLKYLKKKKRGGKEENVTEWHICAIQSPFKTVQLSFS